MAGRLAVVGAGLMGAGIAQVSAQHGWDVVLRDVTAEALARGRAGIEKSLASFVAKGKVEQGDAEAALARITTTTDLDAAAGADVVVEAVFESHDVKAEVFAALDRVCAGDDVVLASNTSAIPITRIAAATAHPERVVGLHFFSPVPLMALVEVVRGYQTGEGTMERASAFVAGIGKTPVTVNRDIAGFVANRMLLALMAEAVSLVENGVATVEDVDACARLGFGHAMGPLQTADMAGLDVTLNAMRNVYADGQDEKFAPPGLLQRMVEAGDLGRKSGRGFYPYG